MKIPHILALILAAGLFAAPAVPADVPAPPPQPGAAPAARAQMPQHRPKAPFAFRQAIQAQVIRSLHLTPEQRVQAKAIRARTQKAIQAVRADPALTEDQKTLRIAALARTGHRQFRELLTDWQREKLFRIGRQLARLRRLLATQP